MEPDWSVVFTEDIAKQEKIIQVADHNLQGQLVTAQECLNKIKESLEKDDQDLEMWTEVLGIWSQRIEKSVFQKIGAKKTLAEIREALSEL